MIRTDAITLVLLHILSRVWSEVLRSSSSHTQRGRGAGIEGGELDLQEVKAKCNQGK